MPIGYVCDPVTGGCGIARADRWYGMCPGCQGLYHCKQTIIDGEGDSDVIHGRGTRELGRVEGINLERVSTGFEGLDRILGTDRITGLSGLAATAGHTVQFVGAPGAGKSTLLLQIGDRMSRNGLRILYALLEESPEKAKARGDRLGIKFNSRMLVTEISDIGELTEEIDSIDPDIFILDSLQRIRMPGYAPGSHQAVVNASEILYKVAESRGMGQFLISQTNKAEDDFAGAKATEHGVDSSMFLRLRRDGVTREIACKTKNRHGATPGYQRYEMTADQGLVEIESESENEQADRSSEEVPKARGSRLRGH